jgi:two-component sensor histidine kinase
MSGTAWPEQAPPTLGQDSTTVFRADLVRPADLTLSRGRLSLGLTEQALPLEVGEDDVERLLLAFEELTSNGLRHGGPPVEVTVTATSAGWLIDVTDGSVDRVPSPAVDRDPAHGGLGLYLVARLCAAHGWAVQRDRKHVWACVRSG